MHSARHPPGWHRPARLSPEEIGPFRFGPASYLTIMLRAYFDETGTHDGAALTGLGGFVGTGSDWQSLEAPWGALLAEFSSLGVTWFHMADALEQSREYARVDKPLLNRIISRAAKELGDRPFTAFFSSVILDDWPVTEDDRAFRERFPEPVDLCCENLLHHLSTWGRSHAPDEMIAPVFARHQTYSARIAAIDARYREDDGYRAVISQVKFGEPRSEIPLQAADLLAHQMGWDVAKRLKPFSLADGGPTYALNWATRGQFVRGNILDASGLELIMSRYRSAGYPAGPVDLF